MNDFNTIHYAEIDSLLREHGGLVVCTVVRAQGSVPRRVGAKMVVLPDGTARGTVGGGLFESLVVKDALAAFSEGRSAVKTYDFREEGASASAFGAICGGNADLFLEVVQLPDQLLIVGGGHCGRALARAAVLLDGLRITLVDDRADYAGRGDLPGEVTVRQVSAAFDDLPALIGPRAYVVLVSKGFASDEAALRQVIGTEVAYIGMMGSRRKVRAVFDSLAADGVPAEALARVHAPIGLPIGAESPAEIAVSILAQVIAARAGRPATRGK